MITESDIIAEINEQAERLALPEQFAQQARTHLVALVTKYMQQPKAGVILHKVIPSEQQGGRSYIAIAQQDRPFVISSLRLLLSELQLAMRRILHPVITVPGVEQKDLSLIFIELERPISKSEASELYNAVKERLRLVARIVLDFDFSCKQAKLLSNKLAAGGMATKMACRSIDWMLRDNFIFLGSARGEPHTVNKKHDKAGLAEAISKGNKQFRPRGICRDQQFIDLQLLPKLDELVTSKQGKELLQDNLLIETIPLRSKIHRNEQVTLIMFVERNAQGTIKCWHAFFGLWTFTAVQNKIEQAPFITEKVRQLGTKLRLAGRRGANENFFRHQLYNYPWEGIVRQDLEQLSDSFVHILQLLSYPRIRVVLHPHSFLTELQIYLLIPRERYNHTIKNSIIDYLTTASNGKCNDWREKVGGGNYAHLELNLSLTQVNKKLDIASLEQGLAECTRNWGDSYLRLLSQEGIAAVNFPVDYRAIYSPEQAVADSKLIATARKDGIAVRLETYKPEQHREQVRLVLAMPGEVPPLVDTYPMLQRAGVRIFREETTEIFPEQAGINLQHQIPDRSKLLAMVSFYLERNALDPDTRSLLFSHRDKLETLIREVWLSRADDDNFNALAWRAGLTINQILLLRTMSSWLRLNGETFSARQQADLLINNADVCKLFLQAFEALHDPAIIQDQVGRASAESWYGIELENHLEQVTSASADMALRKYLQLIFAICRTNYFVRQEGDPIGFKIISSKLDFVVEPRPYREFYIEHRDYRAVHLRLGAIARGGIRWSDRPNDFRDEILGLVKSQQLKNVVIVPSGAKGGFVLKNPPAERDRFIAAGIAAYESFIDTILLLTDNQIGTKVVSPAGIACLDGQDPYLAVAADKGTATFSDRANVISQRHKFWLDDAFASGGSKGYDHKAMGITARGAWESAKQHFLQLDKDPETDPITVVGVGDMSGDVFGNGMLLSRTIKLVAAFNHRHIFIDPDPDPAASYNERKRLFDLPTSSWGDYDRSVLSPDGVIYDRSLKQLPLSSAIKDLLGTKEDKVAPSTLIKLLLRLPVELIYFGGIGTYIKQADESHYQVADPTNESCRIDANQLRCKVICEGANLGLTQKARIAFALRGGLINTDAVDNSAGVNTSDHEVNIKILMIQLLHNNKITRKQRDKLLSSVQQEIAANVLAGNRQLARSLTVQSQAAQQNLTLHELLMQRLESEGKLDRNLMALPNRAELDRRVSKQTGLTRPELAVLLAYAKLDITTSIEAGDLPWQQLPQHDLLAYFPGKFSKDYPTEINQHPLAQQIIVMRLVNESLNLTDCSFLHNLQRWLGFEFSSLLAGYLIARNLLFGIYLASKQIDQQTGKQTNKQTKQIKSHAAITGGANHSADPGQLLQAYLKQRDWLAQLSIAQLQELTKLLLPLTAFFSAEIGKSDQQKLAETYIGKMPVILSILQGTDVNANWLAPETAVNYIKSCHIIRYAQQQQISSEQLARNFVRVGDQYGFLAMEQRINNIEMDSSVADHARLSLLANLYQRQSMLAAELAQPESKLQLVQGSNFYAVGREIAKMQNPSTEAILLWQQALEKYLAN